ncbi:MAG: hypothetical protein ACJAUZ_002386 [Flavobacteriaceae bacterium]
MSDLLNQIPPLKAYLGALPHIGDNWLSGVKGGPKAPTQAACTEAKVFLDALQRAYFKLNIHPNSTRLIMGPIPTGGVSAELKIGDDTMILSFNNSGEMDIDLLCDGVDLAPGEKGHGPLTNAERSVLALDQFLNNHSLII